MRNRETQFALALFVLVLATYAASLNSSFQFDDFHSIVENPAVRLLGNIPLFWVDASASSLIQENQVLRPLGFAFMTLCWKLGGGAAWPFHLLKVVAHFFYCLACYRIWRVVLDPTESKSKLFCMAFTLVLAVHTAFTHTVNYVAASFSQFCAVFFLWSFYYWIRQGQGDERKNKLKSCAFFAAAFFCKEEAVTLGALVLAWEWVHSNEKNYFSRAVLVAKKVSPLFLTTVLLLLWFWAFFPNGYRPSSGVVTHWQYFATQWRAYLYYMKLWFWPANLNADNLAFGFSRGLFEPEVLQAILGNSVVFVSAFFISKKSPFVAWGVFWFYVTLLPSSSVLTLDEAVNEYRMYLSLAGFGGATAYLVFQAVSKWNLKSSQQKALFGALILILFVSTQLRNRVWQTKESFWVDTLHKNPLSFRAMNNLALEYMGAKNFEQALQLLARCRQVAPGYIYCMMNQGLTFLELGRFPEAESAFTLAQGVSPGNTYANYYLGLYYWKNKQPDKALIYLNNAKAISGGKHQGTLRILAEMAQKH